ncbi:MAG TPA: hypothetical protein VMD78_02645 [Candidatus Baltobacteraceae bacterium]|nr:hypothetical protein [Candidatus Baltobacteraceae bacterium]
MIHVTTARSFDRLARKPLAIPEDSRIFYGRFMRGRGLLHMVACRVLGDPEKADLAVENTWWTASHAGQSFEREGAFRSWLIRILLDEAFAILRQVRKHAAGRAAHHQAPRATGVFAAEGGAR